MAEAREDIAKPFCGERNTHCCKLRPGLAMMETFDSLQYNIRRCPVALFCSAWRGSRVRLPNLSPTTRTRSDCARTDAPKMCRAGFLRPAAICRPLCEKRFRRTNCKSVTCQQWLEFVTKFSRTHSSLLTLLSSATKFHGINPSCRVVKWMTRHQSDSVSSSTSMRSPFTKLTSVSSLAV